MIDNRHKSKLLWAQPFEAIDVDGKKIDACVELRATIQDCINIMRAAHASKGLSDEELLQEFMSVNWATFETLD